MKRRTKIGLLSGLVLLGTVILSGCTSSFCSTKDKAHMMYAFDFGVTAFYSENNSEGTRENLVVNGTTYTNIYVDYSVDNCPALVSIKKSAEKNNVAFPGLDYWVAFDEIVMSDVFTKATNDGYDLSKMVVNNTSPDKYDIKEDILKEYGYIKFYYTTGVSYTHTKVRWENWDSYYEKVTQNEDVPLDQLPSRDFVTFYKKQMNTLISSYRSCIAIKDGKYGYYGSAGARGTINLENKTYAYAWSRGFFEGLLVWPIAALTDKMVMTWEGALGVGGASILAIVVVTFIIRIIMAAATFKQSTMNAKMTELQPEIQRIQNKYPNSNSSRQEKMRLAEETNKLYKKHNIHPMRSLLFMFIQFPVFICVWGALSGSAYLSTGEFLKLNLSSSISAVLFNAEGWKTGAAVTALILFLLMAASQTVAMLLPQWLQKRKANKVAKLGKNPARNATNKNMQIFTWVMLIMIIFMGFSLASGMGVYWLIGALFSIAQTLITQYITERKALKNKRK